MIQTASILWAVLATAVGIFLNTINGIVMRDAREIVVLAKELEDQRDTWRSISIALQDKIDRDAAKRSSITSRGNITRAAKRRAKALEQASKLVAPKALDIAA